MSAPSVFLMWEAVSHGAHDRAWPPTPSPTPESLDRWLSTNRLSRNGSSGVRMGDSSNPGSKVLGSQNGIATPLGA